MKFIRFCAICLKAFGIFLPIFGLVSIVNSLFHLRLKYRGMYIPDDIYAAVALLVIGLAVLGLSELLLRWYAKSRSAGSAGADKIS